VTLLQATLTVTGDKMSGDKKSWRQKCWRQNTTPPFTQAITQLLRNKWQFESDGNLLLELHHSGMEQCALKNVNNHLDTNIYSYL
jgi:hypothetical protein